MKRSLGQRRGADDLGQPPGPEPALELHLPEPVLGVDEALREGRVDAGSAPRCAGSPIRSRTTVTGALRPATRISPSICGKDWRSQR